MIATDPKAHKKYIGMRQAKRTIEKIERRQRLGKPKPTDKQALINARATLAKWQQS